MPETIFMIHGMWGRPWCWENYKAFFESRGYQCITPTLRHHDVAPDSPPHPNLGSTSLLEYADDLERELSGLATAPIIMGHSMGGLLAQIVGSRVKAKALVLLTPAAPAGVFSITPSVLRTFFRIMTTWAFWKRPTRLTYEEAVYSMMHLLPEDERRQTYEQLVFESGRAAFEIGFWLLDPRGAARVDESRIGCPVLVVAGAEDRITPASVVRKVALKYGKRATYREFPNHAHWVLGEPGRQEIVEYVEAWLHSVLTEDGKAIRVDSGDTT